MLDHIAVQFICGYCGPPVRVYHIAQDVNEELQFALMSMAGPDAAIENDGVQVLDEPAEIEHGVVHVVLDHSAGV